MAVLNGILKRFFPLFASRTVLPSTQQSELSTELPLSTNGQDVEQAFLANIARLPAAEQQKRIQKRLWYSRMAQRQGIMEAESLADQYQRANER